MLAFPNIDPVAIQIGPLAVRWYSLAYLVGIFAGWQYVARLHRRVPIPGLDGAMLENMLMWAVVGVVGGGRLGYVLFYKPGYYLENPSHIFRLWEGGMSFHGGLLGVILAFILFCRKYKLRFFEVIDVVACATPIGLFLGRLANFINGELFGRPTDVPWGMVFPNGGPLPRHPSQLYEAGLEGVLLFTVLFILAWFTGARRRVGLLAGVFMSGYALSRIISECFREPDAHLGFIAAHVTMGQILSLPMLAYGLYLIAAALKRPPSERVQPWKGP